MKNSYGANQKWTYGKLYNCCKNIIKCKYIFLVYFIHEYRAFNRKIGRGEFSCLKQNT